MAQGFQCDKCKEWFVGFSTGRLTNDVSADAQYGNLKEEYLLCKKCYLHIVDNCINKKECK